MPTVEWALFVTPFTQVAHAFPAKPCTSFQFRLHEEMRLYSELRRRVLFLELPSGDGDGGLLASSQPRVRRLSTGFSASDGRHHGVRPSAPLTPNGPSPRVLVPNRGDAWWLT